MKISTLITLLVIFVVVATYVIWLKLSLYNGFNDKNKRDVVEVSVVDLVGVRYER